MKRISLSSLSVCVLLICEVAVLHNIWLYVHIGRILRCCLYVHYLCVFVDHSLILNHWALRLHALYFYVFLNLYCEWHSRNIVHT